MSEFSRPLQQDEFIPSVIEPTTEERIAARQMLWKLVQEGLGSGDLPPDMQDVMARDHIVMNERSVYERYDTKLIPERVLKDGEPIKLNTIFTLLNVYYWWNDDWQEPINYLEDLLKDLSKERFNEAVQVLHDEFRNLCDNRESEAPCSKKDGNKCFKRWQKRNETLEQSDAEGVTFWLYGIDDDSIDSDDDDFAEDGATFPTFLERLERFTVESLVKAGVDVIEAQDALNVIEKEAESRNTANLKEYYTYRDGGGSAENAAQEFFTPLITDSSQNFRNLTRQYEDIPEDAQDWAREKKVALVRRYVAENAELFEHYESNYLMHTRGFLPFYMRRFAEEFFPPDQRI